ncbi:Uncharacterised protein [Cedecea lapagei]|uniref:Uncharacterized protein n=1 Tax=Cedecea lapagei TaxID=158823 RepID=A0A447V2X5_9ENTR|nr:Uncharacterised protein [Cedecea lapagei]
MRSFIFFILTSGLTAADIRVDIVEQNKTRVQKAKTGAPRS